jgi:hypothetical protein
VSSRALYLVSVAWVVVGLVVVGLVMIKVIACRVPAVKHSQVPVFWFGLGAGCGGCFAVCVGLYAVLGHFTSHLTGRGT